jgi:ComF family protein
MITDKVNFRLFFDRCILCGCKTKTDHSICHDCYKDLPWLLSCCDICALPLPENSNFLICADCQKKKPAFDKVTALFEYGFPVDRIIGQIKYGKKPQFLGHLARIAAQLLELPDDIECIIPVPMHFVSQFRRGFNQSDLLASELAKLLELPVERNLLQKNVSTERQMTLPRAARLKNQKDVFHCKASHFKRVLLVDDVMTTGATLESASLSLKKAGVEQIYVFVIARTER